MKPIEEAETVRRGLCVTRGGFESLAVNDYVWCKCRD